jgi:esterase/lipase
MTSIIRLTKHLGLYLTVAVLGFLIGGLALYIHLVRSGPPLQIWHTETLDSEYSEQNAEEIRTFDDYLRLEQRLFAELDDKIYARTESGPKHALARYSAGSSADPRRLGTDWNRSFELRADNPAGGVLLLHGMSDSPYSLRALGETLNEHGYWIIGLRLPGHGTVPSEFTRMSWEEMAGPVRLGMAHLASKAGTDVVHIIGYSNGAALAIDYALEARQGDSAPVPASLVLISPSIRVTRAAALTKWLGKLAAVPGLEKFAWTSILPEFDPYKYNSFSANAGEQVHRLTRHVIGAVEARAASGPIQDFPPTLVYLSTVDATVSTDAVIDNLLEHLAPHRHELVLFDINRRNVKKSVLVSDPGPLTARLMKDGMLPFSLTLVGNENAASRTVVVRRKASLSDRVVVDPLETDWPRGVISLSHIALPFPPDDPVYGQRDPNNPDIIFLGQMAVQGERGLLQFSSDWLLRLRHNPFYEFLETGTLEWLSNARHGSGG